MTAAEIAEFVRRTTGEQGVSEHVEDPSLLAAIVPLLERIATTAAATP